MDPIFSHLAAVALGAVLVLVASALTARQASRPQRHLERADARSRAVLEADRARLLNLLLARTPEEATALAWTSPAQPPPPDPTLLEPGDPRSAAAALYTPDLNELTDPDADAFDDAALHAARH